MNLESGVERRSQRHIAWVTGQARSHPIGDVTVAEADLRISKAKGPAGAKGAKRAWASERPRGARLHEAKREANLCL
jgi:hypothetical protein